MRNHTVCAEHCTDFFPAERRSRNCDSCWCYGGEQFESSLHTGMYMTYFGFRNLLRGGIQFFGSLVINLGFKIYFGMGSSFFLSQESSFLKNSAGFWTKSVLALTGKDFRRKKRTLPGEGALISGIVSLHFPFRTRPPWSLPCSRSSRPGRESSRRGTLLLAH